MKTVKMTGPLNNDRMQQVIFVYSNFKVKIQLKFSPGPTA